MPKPHTHRRPSRRHKPHPADYTALLSRLTALEAALLKQSGPRGLAEASPSLVRLTADLLTETRAALRGAPPEKVVTGFSVRRRGHSGYRARKSVLPRLCPEHPVSHAELCVVAGQARALLAAFISAKGLDTPPAAPDPRMDMLRAKLVKRLARQHRAVAENTAAAERAETSPSS